MLDANGKAILEGVARVFGPQLDEVRRRSENQVKEVRNEFHPVTIDMAPVAEALGGFLAVMQTLNKSITEQERRHQLALNALAQVIGQLPAPVVNNEGTTINVAPTDVQVNPRLTANLDAGGLVEGLDGFLARLGALLDGFLVRLASALDKPQVVTIEHDDGTRSTVRKA
jgi:hypothetical protein